MTKEGEGVILDKEEILLQVIHEKCKECFLPADSKMEQAIKLCEIKDCPLYPYRFGKMFLGDGVGL